MIEGKPMPMATLIGILGWFQKAVPEPERQNQSTQLGVHFEEVAEMIEALEATDPETHTIIENARTSLEALANRLKTTELPVVLSTPEAEELFIDAICDQIVTAVGVAHMYGMDVIGAAEATNIQNWSKFDDEGNPIFDDNQKIIKGPNYQKADYSLYI